MMRYSSFVVIVVPAPPVLVAELVIVHNRGGGPPNYMIHLQEIQDKALQYANDNQPKVCDRFKDIVMPI
jgi:hypothetical protein